MDKNHVKFTWNAINGYRSMPYTQEDLDNQSVIRCRETGDIPMFTAYTTSDVVYETLVSVGMVIKKPDIYRKIKNQIKELELANLDHESWYRVDPSQTDKRKVRYLISFAGLISLLLKLEYKSTTLTTIQFNLTNYLADAATLIKSIRDSGGEYLLYMAMDNEYQQSTLSVIKQLEDRRLQVEYDGEIFTYEQASRLLDQIT